VSKSDKDKEFFAFAWRIMLADEGYFMAGFFWVCAATVAFPIVVLLATGITPLVGLLWANTPAITRTHPNCKTYLLTVLTTTELEPWMTRLRMEI